MVDTLHLYISAADDLNQERESINRAVAEIPVTIAWRVYQSPRHGEPVNPTAIDKADVYLLLLGCDVRAPIGYEWRLARQVSCQSAAFLKQDIVRTMAASDFVRYIGDFMEWRLYKNWSDLHVQVLQYLSDHILSRPDYYALQATEYAKLMTWRKKLVADNQVQADLHGGIGESSVLLSPERFIPSDGILIQAKHEGKKGDEMVNRRV